MKRLAIHVMTGVLLAVLTGLVAGCLAPPGPRFPAHHGPRIGHPPVLAPVPPPVLRPPLP